MKATYTILPTTSAEIEKSRATADKLLTVLESWEVSTAEDEERAGGLLTSAHGRWRDLETLRKESVKPAVTAQKDINGLFRPALQAWDRVKKRTQQLISQSVAAREAANQARLELAAEGNVVALAQVEEVAPPAGVSYRGEVSIEIVDFDLIPREYLAVDWSKLKICARQGKPAPPGVRFVRGTKVVPTGR